MAQDGRTLLTNHLVPERGVADQDDAFALKFPVYSLLLKDLSGVILLRHGQEMWLPLFTDIEAAATFVERADDVDDCRIVELETPAKLAAFLRNPPSRAGSPDFTQVIIDPVQQEQQAVTLLEVRTLLQALEA
jgi:hypothetical protein